MIAGLSHYSERLKRLESDPDLIIFQNDLVNADLSNEASKAKVLKDDIEKNGIYVNDEFGKTLRFEYEDTRAMITMALRCYLNSLKKSIDVTASKLGGTPKFELVHKEIASCTNLIKQLEDFKKSF
jgi:hypothetical protein